MPKQDIIAIGASAGGVEALTFLVSELPADLQAAVLIVLHIGNGIDGRSLLPEILTKSGPLPVSHPNGIGEIRHGHIYMARPDCHMVVSQGHVRNVYGPKENRARPAINPLFRSAAAEYGSRVTGVILTGTLDDGIAGLAEIRRKGGIAIVQDPATAIFPEMPETARRYAHPDYVIPLEDIPRAVSTLAVTDRETRAREEPVERTLLEIKCPDCGGPLWEERQGGIVEYRCRVGHAYSPLALKEGQKETVERSLWESVVTLQDAAAVAEKLRKELGPDLAREEQERRAQVEAIKNMLPGGKTQPR